MIGIQIGVNQFETPVWVYSHIFHKQHFYKQCHDEFLLLKNYSNSSSMLCHSKIIGHKKNKQKNKFVCFHEIIRLIIMNMEMKLKYRSHRCDINRRRSVHGNKYSKYKKCLSMLMLVCVKQHLSNVWSWIREKSK